MGKSQLEIDIEKCTNENVVKEDWSLILDIVDRINSSNSQKEALKVIKARLQAKDPHIAMNTLSLLNACVSNCNRLFRLEVCSRDFIDLLRHIVTQRKVSQLSDRVAQLIQDWSNDKDIMNDPALSLITSLYTELRNKGIDFKKEDTKVIKKVNNLDALKEEEDLLKAIQLSLKETQITSKQSEPVKLQTQSLYGTIPQVASVGTNSEKKRVKALYDFEAAEENELTFKAGDILIVLDDSDPNWWKGSNFKSEGLFPSTFVTTELNPQVDTTQTMESNKKVTFNEEVAIKQMPPKITIDEAKIDECLELIQNADPTGELQPDSDEFLQLEDSCYGQGPLIDQELQKIDQKHTMLEDLNKKVLEAFQMYHNLMKESLLKQPTQVPQFNPPHVPNYSLSAQNQYQQVNPSLMTPFINPVMMNHTQSMNYPPGEMQPQNAYHSSYQSIQPYQAFNASGQLQTIHSQPQVGINGHQMTQNQ